MIHLGNRKLILASKSPRRAALLQDLALDFEIRTKETAEDFPDQMPVREVAAFLSAKKAGAFDGDLKEGEILITSDTVVVLGGKILGKPGDAEEATEMLASLSGKVHEVITGVTIMDSVKKVTFQDVAQVYFREIAEEEIKYYVDNHKPFDKAGAYGIQEWIGLIAVEKLEGSFYTVMGLPVHRIYEELKKW